MRSLRYSLPRPASITVICVNLSGYWGPKYIHVSIFVSVEFPDDELLKLLKDHGQLKSDALRRLYFTEEGFRHIERGIRVAEFVSITKDLPQKVVTQGLEIFFKYSGQPTTCYRYHSPEHVVKDCLKQRRARPSTSRTTDETRGDSPAEQSAGTSMETQESSAEEQNSATSESSLDSTASQETPRPTFAKITATPELFSEDPLSVDLCKRPPSSPAKMTRPRKRSRTQLNNQKPQLFIRYNRRTTTHPAKVHS